MIYKSVNIYLSSIPRLNLLNKATKSDADLSSIKNKLNILTDINSGLVKQNFQPKLITTYGYEAAGIHIMLGYVGITSMKKIATLTNVL